MSVNNLQFLKNNSGLANGDSKASSNLKLAAIFTVDQSGLIKRNREGVFLLNPSTFEETKSSNWNPVNISGQSDPILQWTSGGPRMVSFTALVTKDISSHKLLAEIADNNSDKGSGFINNVLASIGAKAAGVPSNPDTSQNVNSSSLDISKILNYYRSLQYPLYDNRDNPKFLEASPPLVVLYFGRALIAPGRLYSGARLSSGDDTWVVTNLNIRITKQLPNLAPMEAEVDFQLMHYNVQSFSRDRFYTLNK